MGKHNRDEILTLDVTNQKVKKDLDAFLTGAERIAVLGLGNDLRTDDGLGPYVIHNLGLKHQNLMIENVGSVPEAFARPLAEFGAERVLMIDAADMGKSPGHIELVTKDRIGGISVTTHSMPLSFLMTYLEQETGGGTILIGIQPQNISFGEGLTPEIEKAARNLIDILREILVKHIGGVEDIPNNRMA